LVSWANKYRRFPLFLQRNEYFKGVPIYIVQTSNQPRNLVLEQYYKTAGVIDGLYGRFIQSIDSAIGFGHNWVMQGSLNEISAAKGRTNFVFFTKEQADVFVKQEKRKIVRYNGSRTSNLEKFVQKPKIFIYNLEDFLESWEDKINADLTDNSINSPKAIFEVDNTYFINPIENSDELKKLDNSFILQNFRLRYQYLKRYLGTIFGMA